MSDLQNTFVPRKAKMRETLVHCLPYAMRNQRKTTKARSRMLGVVYFLYCEKADAVKIGFTKANIRNRIGALQGGCPYDLRLIALMNADCSMEAKLHQRFASHWIRGEWFSYSGEVADYIEALCDG